MRQVLLLNGVYGAPEHFDALRAALAPEFETHVVPFRREGLADPTPAIGFTPMVARVETAVAALAHVEPAGRVALIGFSLGGALAIEYALAHPERVDALVLVNAFARYERGFLQAGALPALRAWPSGWTPVGLTAGVMHRVAPLRRRLFHAEMPRTAIERGVRHAARTTASSDLRFQLAHLALREPPDFDRRLRALAVTLPVLLLSSEDDIVVPPRHTDALAWRMPRARRHPPFEGGHAFFQHDAAPLAGVLREFLETAVRTS